MIRNESGRKMGTMSVRSEAPAPSYYTGTTLAVFPVSTRQLAPANQPRTLGHYLYSVDLATGGLVTQRPLDPVGMPGPEEQALARQTVSFAKQLIHGFRFHWGTQWCSSSSAALEPSVESRIGQLTLEDSVGLPLVDRVLCLEGILMRLGAASGVGTLPQADYRRAPTHLWSAPRA